MFQAWQGLNYIQNYFPLSFPSLTKPLPPVSGPESSEGLFCLRRGGKYPDWSVVTPSPGLSLDPGSGGRLRLAGGEGGRRPVVSLLWSI